MSPPDAVGIPLRQLAERCGAELAGDGDVVIDRVATLDSAGEGAIAFLSNPKYRGRLAGTRASAVIVAPGDAQATALPRLVTTNPYAAYARIAAMLHPAQAPLPGVHPTAVVAASARVAASAAIGAQAGHNCHIGAHTAIAGCVGIAGSTTIGRNCKIGGAAMISGHLEIPDGTVISAATGVFDSIRSPGVYTGTFPALPHREWRRVAAAARRLRSILERLRALERARDTEET